MTLTPQIPKVPTKFGNPVHTFEAKSVGPVKQDTMKRHQSILANILLLLTTFCLVGTLETQLS